MHPYYLVGAKFSWDIWDWNKTKKQNQQLRIQQSIIKINKENIVKQVSIEQNEYLQKINQFEKQLIIDKEIEKLKESIHKSAKSQFKNGTITSSEYLRIFNEWRHAQLSSETDLLYLLKAKINYQHSMGVSKK